MQRYIRFLSKWKKLKHNLLYRSHPNLNKISNKTNQLLHYLICPDIKQSTSFYFLCAHLLERIQNITDYISYAENRTARSFSISLVEELAFHLMFIHQYNKHDLVDIPSDILNIESFLPLS